MIFLTALAIANSFQPADRAVTVDMLGHDFLPFYTAGTMARTGHFTSLYDLSAIKTSEAAIAHAAGFTSGFGPWWNPPLAAWLFAPLSFLPFSSALILWELIGAAALAGAILLLISLLPPPGDWRTWGLVPLLLLASSPAIAVAAHAQNTYITLVLIAGSLVCWRHHHNLAAGLVAGLLLYKPQHAVMLGIALVVTRGWRPALGMAVTAAALAAITIVTMPGALTDYAHALPQLVAAMQERGDYSWDRHVTLKAFWRLLLQGTRGPGWPLTTVLWWISEAVVIGRLAMSWRDDRFMVAAIAAGPLLVPFCFDYDLLILAAPAVLCTDRSALRAWITLYLVMYISPPLASAIHMNLATIALAALVWNLTRRRRVAAAIPASEPMMVKLAA